MGTKLTTLLTGAVGMGASKVAQNVNLEDIQQGAGILTQIVILVVTLLGLFKKKKA